MGHAGRVGWIGLAVALALGSCSRVVEDPPASSRTALQGSPGEPRQAMRAPGKNGHELVRFEAPASASPGAVADSFAVIVSRQAALDSGRTGTLTAVLPDGTRYPVRYERSMSAPDGNWTFIGRVDTPVGALAAVITFGRDSVFGLLPGPDGSMMKLTTRAGRTYLQPAGWSVPPGVDPSRHPDYVLAPAPGARSMRHSEASASSAAPVGQLASEAGGEVTITVLAAYTKNLSQLRGSAFAAQTEYRNLVAVMNQAHVDSGSRARFEVAGFVEVDYPANEWNAEARKDIIDNTLPDGTNLHALRDNMAADLVALIRPYVEGDLTCGISQFPGAALEPHWLDPGTGFSVTAVEACAPLVFAHEIGHNLGLMHDRDTVAGPHGSALFHGPYRFSFGHRQLGPPGFATVMAYNSESRPRLGYFSHPGTTLCGGAACGDAALADNVRSINLVAESIARFRDPPGVISIADRWVREAAIGSSSIEVKLSSPAPAGGITFDLDIEGGSAELGVDANVAPNVPLADVVIAEGGTNAIFFVEVLDDGVAERPETIHIRLQNVRGNVLVLDDAATLTIVDDDRTVRVEGTVRFPSGAARPTFVRVGFKEVNEGFSNEGHVVANAPDFDYSLDVAQGAFLSLNASTDSLLSPDTLRMQDVAIESVENPMVDVDLRIKAVVRLSGRLRTQDGQEVAGVPVILWNPNGDGWGYYANWASPGYVASYSTEALSGISMQLEVRNPPPPYVRQIVEVPSLMQAATIDVQLRDVPSLTIPHVTVTEGSKADGARTVLLTASLSVPRSKTGVTFDIELAGTADANDFHLPTTRFTIPRLSSRVEVPIVIIGDGIREPDETVELHITNVQGAAWNPGPGSVRIASDDQRPGDGKCTGSTTGDSVRMCQ